MSRKSKDAVLRIKDGDESSAIKIDEDTMNKILECVKNDLEEHGIEVGDSLLLPKHFAPKPNLSISEIEDMHVGDLTAKAYRSNVHDAHVRAAIAFAKRLPQNFIPATTVKDSSLEFGGVIQNLVPLEDSVDGKFDKSKYITADSFFKAAAALGSYDLIFDSLL